MVRIDGVPRDDPAFGGAASGAPLSTAAGELPFMILTNKCIGGPKLWEPHSKGAVVVAAPVWFSDCHQGMFHLLKKWVALNQGVCPCDEQFGWHHTVGTSPVTSSNRTLDSIPEPAVASATD